MPYRNKTFVSFASEDIRSYRLMQAWRENERIEFDFLDAHDLNTALDSSQPETIERRLSERLANTKQVVMLIGDVTRAKAQNGVSFIHHEVAVIKRLGLPVVFANLNQSRSAERNRLPSLLLEPYTISVSFQPKIIMRALDDYVDAFQRNKTADQASRKTGPYYYESSFYAGLGL
jgi:hypothetical protein